MRDKTMFGRYLQKYRGIKCLKQSDMAKALKMQPQGLRDIESGVRNPTALMAGRCARYLHLDERQTSDLIDVAMMSHQTMSFEKKNYTSTDWRILGAFYISLNDLSADKKEKIIDILECAINE